jgi:hypothetical protein
MTKTQPLSLSSGDQAFLASQGITESNAMAQAERIHQGFAPVQLVGACTPQRGVSLLSDYDLEKLSERYLKSLRPWSRFVPASGASSRMFQAWLAAVSEGSEEHPEVKRWNADLSQYPFVPTAPQYEGFGNAAPLRTQIQEFQGLVGLSYLMKDLGFANLPKAAVPFHRYPEGEIRNPLDEHLAEASASHLAVHFTVSPEHENLFKHLMESAKQKGFDVPVSYSFQGAATQSLALDAKGKWVRTESGDLLLRPSGHGALLPNLAAAPTPWVFIRNIDNVIPAGPIQNEASKWRFALGGLLLSTWEQVYKILAEFEKGVSENRWNEIVKWCCETFGWDASSSQVQKLNVKTLAHKLRAPIRVCGVVRNTGEPGGGPFFTRDSSGWVSPQIVESAQVDRNNPEQAALFAQATHFNPVELVCALADDCDRRFDLEQFVDPETGFRVDKSYLGKPLQALEKPGLWNGSMAKWLTVFVEIPEICFAPVKTVHDLLRPEHQVSV